MFTRAIVRPPAPNFAEGLTTSGLGTPDYELALEQHEAYCAALERCGLILTRLDPDPVYPDSTFVEDVAVLTERCAVVTRPGALSRLGEIESIRPVLSQFFSVFHEIRTPGTLDGGDICQAGEHFFIGISERTNEAGARQLAEILASTGYESGLVNLSGTAVPPVGQAQDARASLLHLKSGLAYLGENRFALTEALCARQEFAGFESIDITPDEEYAANCIRVNDYVLIAAGYPKIASELSRLGHKIIALDMSEFQKMDGGLSCLSLRF